MSAFKTHFYKLFILDRTGYLAAILDSRELQLVFTEFAAVWG
jgi:hypothetical protein